MDSPAPPCSQCGFQNPPQMRFCGNCGTALAPSSTKAAEERKLVTVLFADVVGSTELSGALDPERLHSMITGFFGIAREEIERYGGTVEKFIGDAVMAVFGLPAVHEDDPERAVRAAAAIRARILPEIEKGTLPEIRVGINTGEVVADVHASEKGEFLVTGETVNLAARLQQHAETGQILIGERTMQAVRHIARLEHVPSLTVKGAAAPILAWAIVDVQPPRARQLRATPFVGREEELALLQGHLRRMLREGRGHVVTILGPAGVGKTRLAREFRSRAEHVNTLSGRAVPYGTGVPFWALGEAIRDECGVLFNDPLDEARQKVHDTASTLEIADAAPALLSVLGMAGVGIDLTKDALFAGMHAFFQALAQRSSLLIILEDLHLAEEVTLDFLEHAADWIRNAPILLLGLARPELLERRVVWMGGKRSATTMVLDPFGDEASRELIETVLGHKLAPDALIDRMTAQAEGNPLFMEEILHTLIDRGVLAETVDRWELTVPLADVAIPDTVHAVLAARVDALPPSEKQVLQDAALQGKEFWRGGLLVVADGNHIDETVRSLEAKELIIPKRRSSLAGEEEFAFRHILIRDVAYSTIPKGQRWPKHARIAAWMETIIGNRRAEFADFIAHHWLQVLGLRRELGLPADLEAQRHAVDNLLIAGERAAGVYANATALDHYTRALDLDLEPVTRLGALLSRGDVWMLLGQYERAREDFTAVRTLAQATDQVRWEALALDHLGHTFRKQDQIARALEHLQPALHLSRQVNDPDLSGNILNHIGFSYFSASRHHEAIRAHDEARRLLEGSADRLGLAESLHGLGENQVFLGRFTEGIQRLEESVRLCEQVGNRSLAGENHYMVGIISWLLGDYAKAQAETQKSMTILAEIGDIWNLSFALHVAAGISATWGELGRALDYATRGLGFARQVEAVRPAVRALIRLSMVHREIENFHGAWQADTEAVELTRKGEVGAFTSTSALAGLALDALGLGRMDDARAYVEQAQLALEETESVLDYPQEVTHARAQVCLALGHEAEGDVVIHELLSLVTSSGAMHWRIPALVLEAEATVAWGDAAAAVVKYELVTQEAERWGRLPIVWRALAGLAEARTRLGQYAEAASAARRAREIIDRLAATISDERLRATFLQSARVQRITALIAS